jgi:hypothetical protein
MVLSAELPSGIVSLLSITVRPRGREILALVQGPVVVVPNIV